MDSKRTTDECLELWAVISDNDKKTVAENILKISRAMDDSSEGVDAYATLGKYKHEIIKQYNLKNHMHPAFMQVQILMDLLYSDKRINGDYFQYTLDAFKIITASLATDEKLELQRNLQKFIKSQTLDLIGSGPGIVNSQEIKKHEESPKRSDVPGAPSTEGHLPKKWKLTPNGLLNLHTGEMIPAKYLKSVKGYNPGFEITSQSYSVVWVLLREIDS